MFHGAACPGCQRSTRREGESLLPLHLYPNLVSYWEAFRLTSSTPWCGTLGFLGRIPAVLLQCVCPDLPSPHAMDSTALIPSCELSPIPEERRLACHCCVTGTAQGNPKVTERDPPPTREARIPGMEGGMERGAILKEQPGGFWRFQSVTYPIRKKGKIQGRTRVCPMSPAVT